HACLVADALGMTRALIHPLAGVLSAYGMGLADITAMREASVELVLQEDQLPQCERVLDTIGQSAYEEVASQGVAAPRIKLVQRAHLRYEGTNAALVVAYGSAQDMQARFEQTYSQRYSFLMPDKRLVIEAVSVEAVGLSAEQPSPSKDLAPSATQPTAQTSAQLFVNGTQHSTP